MKMLSCRAALFAAFCLAQAGFAQSDLSQVSGFVKDPSGSGIPAAVVTATEESTNLERGATANETGYYTISNLPPGTYDVTVRAAGFKVLIAKGNRLQPGLGATLDAQMEIGNVAETVAVTGTAALVQAESAALGKLVESRQLENLMLNGRDPLFLALLMPGITATANSFSTLSYDVGGGSSYNINGSRIYDNNLFYDGAEALRARGRGRPIGIPDADATQEVQILTANYSAEYGGTSGGQVRVVTKSGTRDLHGSFYEFLQNDKLDANTWSRNASPLSSLNSVPVPYRFNQFGFALGGPVIAPHWNRGRNKAFWLYSLEMVRHRKYDTNTVTVPSLAMRQGDFSELLKPNNFYSGTTALRDPTTAQPFPNNIIPKSRLSPNGIGLLNAYPLPTPGFQQGTANQIESLRHPLDQIKQTLSLDYNLSEKHQFRYRLHKYNETETNPFQGSTDRAPLHYQRPTFTTSLDYVWLSSPTLVNEFIVTTSVDRYYIVVDTSTGTYSRSQYGINFPYVLPNEKSLPDRIPSVSLPSPFVTLTGGVYPSHAQGDIGTASWKLTKIFANHAFKAGALYERQGLNNEDQVSALPIPGFTNNQNGQFFFLDNNPAGTGRGVANAALGVFDSYGELGPYAYTPYRANMFEWFVEDSWKATQKLRIEAGLRHSIAGSEYSPFGNLAAFDRSLYDPAKAPVLDPKTGQVLSANQYSGMVILGSNWPKAAMGRLPIASTGQFDFLHRGYGNSFTAAPLTDFQPRLGIAYAMNSRTVLRGGAGRFVTRSTFSDAIFLGANPPFQQQISISGGSVDHPGTSSVSTYPLYVTTTNTDLPSPNSWAWNATFEHEIGFETAVEVSYVGRRSVHLPREGNINQLPLGTVQANPGISADYLRPYKGYGVIVMQTNDTNAMYQGLQIELRRRFSKGLGLGVAYTYAHSHDDASIYNTVLPNAFNASTFWGPSDFDIRQVMVINYVYQLPFFSNQRRLSGKLLGGWSISGISQFQSGPPLTAGTGDDFAGVGPGGGSQIWNVNGSFELPADQRNFSNSNSSPDFYFKTKNADGSAIFTAPRAGTFTSQFNRNIIRGVGIQAWNAAIFKAFSVTEKHRLELRGEAFDLFNHPGWNNPSTAPTSASFGKVTAKGATGARAIQVSLKYKF